MSNLKVMNQQLEKASSVKEALQLGFVQELFVKNFAAVTGRKDGQNRFAAEVFSYLELIQDNDKVKKCSKFSHMACLVKAGTTGLSFGKEGQLYVIPYGDVAKVQIGAHGKRELLRRMPDVKMVGESQLVLKGDTFKHDKLNNKVIEHITSEKAPDATLENVIAAYVRIQFKDNSIIDVVVTHEDLVKAKSKSKQQGPGSVWEQWSGEMCKKVPYNRAYKLYYRQPQTEVATEFKGFDADEEDTDDISHEEVRSEPSPDGQSGPQTAVTQPVQAQQPAHAESVKKDALDF